MPIASWPCMAPAGSQERVTTASIAFEDLREDSDERDPRADQVSDRRLAAVDVESIEPLLTQAQRDDAFGATVERDRRRRDLDDVASALCVRRSAPPSIARRPGSRSNSRRRDSPSTARRRSLARSLHRSGNGASLAIPWRALRRQLRSSAKSRSRARGTISRARWCVLVR